MVSGGCLPPPPPPHPAAPLAGRGPLRGAGRAGAVAAGNGRCLPEGGRAEGGGLGKRE